MRDRINNMFLFDKIKEKLIFYNIISFKDDISIVINKINLKYYIVDVKNKNQKFIIKEVKEKDYSYNISCYIDKINKNLGSLMFPLTVAPPFSIDEHIYIIVTYLEGKSLRTLVPTLTKKELLRISSDVSENLRNIHSITEDYFFEGNAIKSKSFYEIIINKIYNLLQNKYVINYLNNIDIDNDKLFYYIKGLLNNESYSQPTLIHMDINPGNIIISPSGSVHIIDFELARFGELDYEWTNLLSKTLHPYQINYKKYVLNPIIENNFMTLDEALKNCKYKIYILYHSFNFYIFCIKSNRPCPTDVLNIINSILNELLT